ncbi:uncharacterized protein LOC135924043 [Gordionus sp. m RMFG-2023]|uniref:uncharacterized protein LOC135924043 n=1 Tax=Gordionus sp. m RMFG-2023 TaxID=3053472 RepID=UPI0031FC8664
MVNSCCQVCLKIVSLNLNGVFRKHGSPACHNSGKFPLSYGPDPLINAPHSYDPIPPCSSSSVDLFLNSHKPPVLSRIPIAARESISRFLMSLINNLNSDFSSLPLWLDLVSFCFRVLVKPKNKINNLSALIKEKVSNFGNTIIDEFSPSYALNPNSFRHKLISEKLDLGDISGAARILSSDDSISPINVTIFKQLLEKHPRASPFNIHPHASSPIPFTCDEVLKCLKSFKKGTTGGLDGFRPGFFVELIQCPDSGFIDPLLKALTELCNNILVREVPLCIRPIIFGARLVSLTKPDGGVRPIAIGSFFRRLVAKAIVNRIRPKASSFLFPSQLGFGVRGGCEVASHVARIFINTEADKVFCKLDFRNAFNTIHRRAFLPSFLHHFPKYGNFLNSCYGFPSLLKFGEFSISSEEGIQQGDPLGPLLFTIGIHDLIKNLKTNFQLDLNLWYLDDGSFGGSLSNVMSAIEYVEMEASKIGLSLNRKKSEISSLNNKDFIPPLDFTIIPHEELCLLGSPIGFSTSFCQKTFDDLIHSLSNSLKNLPHLPKHQFFFLTKKCLFLPKFLHLFKSSPVFQYNTLLKVFELKFKHFIESLLGLNFSDFNWSLASMPAYQGGLGLLPPFLMAIACFLSSRISFADSISSLIELDDPLLSSAKQEWLTLITQGSEQPISCHLKSFLVPMLQCSFEKLCMYPELTNLQLLRNAKKNSNGHEWLDAIPSGKKETLLTDDEFQTAIGHRLGCLIPSVDTCAACHKQVDPFSRHCFSCLKVSGRFLRHDNLNRLIGKALISAGFPNSLEPLGLLNADGKRPDGMSLTSWHGGKRLVWDVSCVTSFPANGNTDSLELQETNKFNKYRFLPNSFLFIPLIFSVLGNPGPQSLKFLNQLGRRISLRTGVKNESLSLKQKVQFEILKGNYKCFFETLPFPS